MMDLYHGTSGTLESDTVLPYDGYAYATSDLAAASRIAAARAHSEGMLFGAVYMVDPLSSGIVAEQYNGTTEYRDHVGYRATAVVSWPVNVRAV